MTAVPAENTPLQRGLITVCVMLATVMQVLDMTIANVALAHMQGSMSADHEQISWVLTSYIVAAAVMTPPTGVLAARIGRKRLFAIAVAGFTVASVLCGSATSLFELVVYRILQGAFGAGLVPISQALLLDTYPREKHGSAMAMWGLGVMVGPILGPLLGGYLTEVYSWRWVFYINLPIGVLALVGILAFVPETRRVRSRGFDFFGFALLSLGIGALQMMLDRGGSLDWFASVEIVVEAVFAGLFLYMFIVHMATAEQPFLAPGLFKDRNFAVGLVLMFVVGIVLFATLALLPPFLQHVMHFSVLTTGYVMAPRGVGTMVAMVLVGRLVGKVDARWLILIGLGLTSLSLWQMTGFTMYVDTWTIVHTGVTQGFGLGLVFVPLTTISFSTLAPHYRTEGAAMFSLVRNIGSSIGISTVVTLLGYNTQVNHASLAEGITPFRSMLQTPWLPEAWDWSTTAGVIALNDEVTRQASTIAYLNDFVFMMWLTLLSAPLLLLLGSARRGEPVARRP